MLKEPKVIVLRTAGTNCNKETSFAFAHCGADVEEVHINELKRRQKKLADYHILAIPGGFSYGDDIAAGKILANELKYALIGDLRDFIAQGRLIIGICNGFQVMVKAGILPGNTGFVQEATLTINDCAKFEDRWVYLKKPEISAFGASNQKPERCVWTKKLPEIIYLPVAHGEGKFVVKDNLVLQGIRDNGQIVFQYCSQEGELSGYPDNPNGSLENIAGICDATGRILGLMPHPERHSFGWQHPRWMRRGLENEGDGLAIFRNGVEYARENF